MSDPYARGLVPGNPYTRRRMVRGRVVVVMDMRLEGRALELMRVPSRAVVQGAIHELIVTDERAEPGDRVDRVAYLGFFEVTHGGVLRQGDRLDVGGETVAALSGFDATHAPNHLNIVLRAARPRTGEEMGWRPETELVFLPSEDPLP